MTRLVTVLPLVAGPAVRRSLWVAGPALRRSLCVVVVWVAGISPASAQFTKTTFQPVTQVAAAYGELQGVVTDDRGEPLGGAVVSALGSTTAFAVTDRAGRFSFRTLPPGPYLVRAHLQGYVPARGRIIQVNIAGRALSSIALVRRASANEPPQVLAAGVGGSEQPTATSEPAVGDHDHSEPAWRLRHLKRSVLKDVGQGVLIAEDDDSFLVDSLETIGRAMGTSARVASSMLADLSLSGQVNLLTSTSLDRPQDLFSVNARPHGVTFVTLGAPTGLGDWTVHGAMTQGDLASWLLAGSFVRRAAVTHQYHAGLSYSMQRYEGGNPAALLAVADGSRNAGSVYAFDRWAVTPIVTLTYGARYARYDYLERDGLFSPRLSVTVSPVPALRLRASAAHREVAPGAEEFMPPGDVSVWLPPERTFSPISARHRFRPERMDHYEVGGEHDVSGGMVVGLRAFHQRVHDQVITMFGVSLPDMPAADIGHYYVASGGDVTARGWGASLARALGDRVRGTVEYTQTNAEWTRMAPDHRVVSLVARSVVRTDAERIHDLTTSVHTELPVTATRVFVLYKVNSGFAAADPTARTGRLAARFDVQVNQALPFLDFTSAQWEMLLAVRSLFREDPVEASTYDELYVVKPPTRIVGGLTVRF